MSTTIEEGAAKYLTTSEAAAILGASRETVRRLLNAQKLPGVRLGGRWYIDAERLYRLAKGAE